MSLDVCLYVDIDTGSKDIQTAELYDANITHNLGRMASEAGIYDCLWRPDENNIEMAEQLIEPLEHGLQSMKDEPERFKKFNASNGWGLYEHFIPWIENYIDACKEHPKAKIRVSR